MSETGIIVNRLPAAEMLNLNGQRERSFLFVTGEADLQRALPLLDEYILGVYKRVPFNVFEMTGKNQGKIAIESADPKFYFGMMENSLLYIQNPPISNGLLSLTEEGKLEPLGARRHTVESDLTGRLLDILQGVSDNVKGWLGFR